MVFQKWEDLREDDLLEQITKAKEQGLQAKKNEPRAKFASYEVDRDLVVLELTNGCLFCFPSSLVEGLEGATLSDINSIWLSSSGDSIHWDNLNISLSVPNLLLGSFGTSAWMSEIGRKGGKRTSITKAKSSRENGKKGGRPRKKIS